MQKLNEYINLIAKKKGGAYTDYFPEKNSEILIDDVGKYSISKPYAVEKITNIIKKNINPYNLTITDGFACIGGDTLGFSRIFKHVNSNELDETRFKYLQHNMNLFDRKNITFYNKDYFELVKEIKQDVIYLDPPWGGVDYKNEKKIKIVIGDKKFEDLCRTIVNEKLCKLLILKLPFNYDLDELKTFCKTRIYLLGRILIVIIKIT
jgi:16S rRNA G966 N2-methylase RsmD